MDFIQRNDLIIKNLPFIKKTVLHRLTKYPIPHSEYNDFINQCIVAIIPYIEKYDASKCSFATYLFKRLSGAVVDELRERDVLSRKYRKEAEGNLIETIYLDGENIDENILMDKDNHFFEDIDYLVTPLMRNKLNQLVEFLSDREKEVLFLYVKKRMSMREIAKKIGVSEAYISLAYKKIVEKLKLGFANPDFVIKKSVEKKKHLAIITKKAVGRKKGAFYKIALRRTIADLLRQGNNIRETSRLTGAAKNTVTSVYKEINEDLKCKCGKNLLHRGWCSFRVSKSKKRQIFLKQWNKNTMERNCYL